MVEKIKPSQQFDTSTAEIERVEEPLVSAKQLFEQESFSVSEIEQPTDDSVAEIIEKPRIISRKWKAIFGAGFGLMIWQVVDSVMSAIAANDVLSLSWTLLVGSVAALGVGALGKEWLKLRRLKRQFELQDQVSALIESNDKEHALQLLNSLHQYQYETPFLDDFRRHLLDEHSTADMFELYDQQVLYHRDAKAKEIIARYSSQCGVLVAASPFALADMLIVAWRTLAMMNKLSAHYGVELGYWSRISLLRKVFVLMVTTAITDTVVDAGSDMLSMDMTAKISARIGQGLGVGLLVARLGIRTCELLRPLKWRSDNRIRMTELRPHIIKALKNLTFTNHSK